MHKITSSILALLALSSTSISAPSKKPVGVSAGSVIPGSYIITLKDNIPSSEFDALVQTVQSSIQEDANSDIKHIFNIGDSFQGFSGSFDDSYIESLKKQNIYNIEQDQIMTISDTQNNPPSWGLARVGSNLATVDFSTYQFPDNAGDGVTVFVIDTGCMAEHDEFEGRASHGFSAFTQSDDGNGHGTHVSGTIAGKNTGVAKKSSVVCVKVLDDDGSGSNQGVIAGVNWVAQNAKGKKAVANMSLGGGVSAALDSAVQNAIKAGVTFVVAAGNSNADACQSSPARVPTALTIGAADRNNQHASFSNFGSCVNVYGPGVDIQSSWIDSSSSYNVISGTSMASPHVAGVAAVYLSIDPSLTPSQLHSAVISRSTKNFLNGVPAKTPNAIAYVN